MQSWAGDEKFLRAAEDRMTKAVDALTREFARLRTGRASAALLDGIRVEAYGGVMPLNQLAGVSTPEPRLIVVQPWDKSLMAEIERAIMRSDLGLTPSSDGQVIRLPVPSLTDERRKDLTRVVRRHAEEARVEIRLIRREANEELKAGEKDDQITEDEHHRLSGKVQELTDRTIARIDEFLAHKEKEIMEG